MSKAARHTNPLRQIVRTLAAVLAECAYAQRRMAELNTAPDRYMFDPASPPDTYAEFLYRTSGVLRREPAADARAKFR